MIGGKTHYFWKPPCHSPGKTRRRETRLHSSLGQQTQHPWPSCLEYDPHWQTDSCHQVCQLSVTKNSSDFSMEAKKLGLRSFLEQGMLTNSRWQTWIRPCTLTLSFFEIIPKCQMAWCDSPMMKHTATELKCWDTAIYTIYEFIIY